MGHFSATHLRLCFGALPSAVRFLLRHLEECPACRAEAAESLLSCAEALLAETASLPLIVSTLQALHSTDEDTTCGLAPGSRPN
jgi:hypothetical protein